jgi:uncharacterized membrane protein
MAESSITSERGTSEPGHASQLREFAPIDGVPAKVTLASSSPASTPRAPSPNAGLSPARLMSLADGVFAFAMTMLVMNLRLPSRERIFNDGLWRVLGEQWPAFLGYVQSFVVVGIYWVGHHAMFQWIRHSSRVFVWINLLFLLCVTFIPFPTAILGEAVQSREAIILYGSTLILTGLSLYWLWTYAARNGLVDASVTHKDIEMVSRRILMAPAVYAVSIGLCFISVTASIFIYIAVPILYVMPTKLDRKLGIERAKR